MARNTAAYEPGYLARFTAAITSAVPQFDPVANPIGHALAIEVFAPAAGFRAPDESGLTAWPEPAVAARARALATGSTDTVDDIVGDLVELPTAVSDVEWFGTPPTSDDGVVEHVRMAG